MRLPPAGGTGDGGHCCRCVVLGASFLCAVLRGQGEQRKIRGRDMPPIHWRYRWWRGMLKGW